MINISKVRTYSVKKRFSKVNKSDFAKPPRKGRSFRAFMDSLPGILKAKDIRVIAEGIVAARGKGKAVIFMGGAHVIKCGLNPVLIELFKKKVITCVCLNGAGVIHDFELAFQGSTSEDVALNLRNGSFGMGRETAEFINAAVKEGVADGLGFGYAVARAMERAKLPNRNSSLLCNAYRLKIPVCVFVAIGTDIIHQHPSFDGGLTGEASARDFYCLVEEIKSLDNGGVVVNFGSAVIMPEVFLKALNLARNLGKRVGKFSAANFDMIHQYRSFQNVVSRPVEPDGKGYYVIGHHEIMLPLLAQAIAELL